jgi:hypothetical protein
VCVCVCVFSLSLSLSQALVTHLSLSRECRPRREAGSNTQYFRTFVLAALAAALPALVCARGWAGVVVSLAAQRLKVAAVLKHDAIGLGAPNWVQLRAPVHRRNRGGSSALLLEYRFSSTSTEF